MQSWNNIIISKTYHTYNHIYLYRNSNIKYHNNLYRRRLSNKNILTNTIFGPFITSLIGLIPNCSASVILTELYLNSSISLGSLIGGLLTSSGAAILVLIKNNKNIKENISIILLLYFLGAISGILIELINLIK